MIANEGRVSFYPVYSSYTVYGELVYRNISLKIEHQCSHETLGYAYVGSIVNFQSSYDKICAKVVF